jgi:nucleotide-binding universal stress UspA family protein
VNIARRKLDNLRTLYHDDLKLHLRLGKVTDTIVNFAEKENFDLIVMGTKGAFGIKEKLSGSETQFVARNSKVPLLSLMCDRSDLHINHLLLVHNFSNPQNENLNLMKKITQAFDVKIHLLQVASKNSKEEHDNINANMKKFAELNGISDFECHIVNDKDVENGVIHFNQMNNMDIICIGTHGKGGLFHNSATEKLVNHMFKPIITFHLN